MIKKETTKKLKKEKKKKPKIGKGINKTNSTSKIRKITANKKKRIEKGSRAVPRGSNPHSKGELFSRSLNPRLAKDQAIIQTEIPINKDNNKPISNKNINIEDIIS